MLKLDDLIALGEERARERDAAHDLWTWLPSHAAAARFHDDYACEHRPALAEIMKETAMVFGFSRHEALTEEHREWFRCPCDEPHEGWDDAAIRTAVDASLGRQLPTPPTPAAAAPPSTPEPGAPVSRVRLCFGTCEHPLPPRRKVVVDVVAPPLNAGDTSARVRRIVCPWCTHGQCTRVDTEADAEFACFVCGTCETEVFIPIALTRAEEARMERSRS